MAALLFSIVIIFLLCHTTRLVLNIYEAVQVKHIMKRTLFGIPHIQMVHYGTIQSWPGWADNLTRWNHLMLVVNSSINIVIYTAKVFSTLVL